MSILHDKRPVLSLQAPNKKGFLRTSSKEVKVSSDRALKILGIGTDTNADDNSRGTYYLVGYRDRTALIDRKDLHEGGAFRKSDSYLWNVLGYSSLNRSDLSNFVNVIRDYEEELSDPIEYDFQVARGIGWQNGVYVTPFHHHVATKKRVEVYRGDNKSQGKWKTKGTLRKWKKFVAKPFGKYSDLLAFGLCVAFVPPLLKLMNREPFSVNLVGPAQSGKTAWMRGCASVWGGGGHNGFTELWRVTENGVEDFSAEHKDALLCLDDTSRLPGSPQKRAQALFEVIFGQEGGKEKKRKGAGEPAAWTTILLSTSNDSAAKTLRDGGLEWSEQLASRFLEVTVPVGKDGAASILDSIPEDYKTHQEYVDEYLRKYPAKYYGTPIDAYLDCLAKDWRNTKTRRKLKEKLEEYEREFREKCRLRPSVYVRGRAENAFALIYAAGRLACDYKVLPWEVIVVRQSVLRAFHNYSSFHAKNKSVPALEMVQKYLKKNAKNLVEVPAWGKKPKISKKEFSSIPGFIKLKNGQKEYLIPKWQFEIQFCAGSSVSQIVTQLQPYLKTEPNGKGEGRVGQKIRNYKRIVVRSNSDRDDFYVLKSDIMKT